MQMLMPNNFTLYEKIYIQRLIFLFLFGNFCSLQFFIEKKDPEIEKKEKYDHLVKNSKEVKYLANDCLERFSGQKISFKGMKNDFEKIKSEKMRERERLHQFVLKAQGDEEKEKEIIAKYQQQISPDGKRAKKKKARIYCCILIGLCYAYRQGYLMQLFRMARSQVAKR